MSENIFEYDSRLDTQFLHSIYEDDYEHAAFIFEQFLLNYSVQIKEIDDNFREGNIGLFRQKLHKMKATFSFVGLTNLTSKAEIIERKCQDGTEKNTVANLYHDFKNDLAELIPIVESEYKRLKA